MPYLHEVCSCGRKTPQTMSAAELRNAAIGQRLVWRAAAKLRIVTDRRLALPTPEWVSDLARQTGEPQLRPDWQTRIIAELAERLASGARAAVAAARHSLSSTTMPAPIATSIGREPDCSRLLTPGSAGKQTSQSSSCPLRTTNSKDGYLRRWLAFAEIHEAYWLSALKPQAGASYAKMAWTGPRAAWGPLGLLRGAARFMAPPADQVQIGPTIFG